MDGPRTGSGPGLSARWCVCKPSRGGLPRLPTAALPGEPAVADESCGSVFNVGYSKPGTATGHPPDLPRDARGGHGGRRGRPGSVPRWQAPGPSAVAFPCFSKGPRKRGRAPLLVPGPLPSAGPAAAWGRCSTAAPDVGNPPGLGRSAPRLEPPPNQGPSPSTTRGPIGHISGQAKGCPSLSSVRPPDPARPQTGQDTGQTRSTDRVGACQPHRGLPCGRSN